MLASVSWTGGTIGATGKNTRRGKGDPTAVRVRRAFDSIYRTFDHSIYMPNIRSDNRRMGSIPCVDCLYRCMEQFDNSMYRAFEQFDNSVYRAFKQFDICRTFDPIIDRSMYREVYPIYLVLGIRSDKSNNGFDTMYDIHVVKTIRRTSDHSKCRTCRSNQSMCRTIDGVRAVSLNLSPRSFVLFGGGVV